MIALAAASPRLTSDSIRRANHFDFHPTVEVAVIFLGIFATMRPALDLLRSGGSGLGVREPWQFFWATGSRSSFLDNAPTYLAFLAIAQGQDLPSDVAGVPHDVLAAISLGAVFMGANTYIGNVPNFMVRSIGREPRRRDAGLRRLSSLQRRSADAGVPAGNDAVFQVDFRS